MSTPEPAPDSPTSGKTVLLAFACGLLFCAATAAIVLMLISRSPDPPPAETTSPTATPSSTKDRAASGSMTTKAALQDPSATTQHGAYVPPPRDPIQALVSLQLREPYRVYTEARETSKVLRSVPAGTSVHIHVRQGKWTLVDGSDASGEMWVGWIQLGGGDVAAREARAIPDGTGRIEGLVRLNGTPPQMTVPTKRSQHDVCQDAQVPLNAVIVDDGRLQDVLVRIEPGGVAGNWAAPERHAEITQIDCMYVPRIQGVVAGQTIDIKNDDATLHNVHTYKTAEKGIESWFNQGQPKQSPAITKELEEGIIKFSCDVHPWMRAFVVVTDHPFFDVTVSDGSYRLDGVPPGKYTIQAWHSQYGQKTQANVEIKEGGTVNVDFTYAVTDPTPAVNVGELEGLN